MPDTGDVRRDLRNWVRAFAGYSGQPGTVPLLRAAAAASAESDEVAARMYEHVTPVAEAALSDRLRAAGHAGELPGGSAVATLLSQAIIGAFLYRLLTRLPLTADFADDLVNSVGGGIDPTPAADPATENPTGNAAAGDPAAGPVET